MAPPAYIYRLDLHSGSARDIPRAAVSYQALTEALTDLEHAWDAGPTQPVIAGSLPHGWLTLGADSTARKMQVVIWWGSKGRRLPVLTVALALRKWPGSGALYGKLLEGTTQVHPAALQEPRAPWLAVRREAAWDELPPDLAAEYDKYPAVLGWAWIERGKPATGMP